MCNRTCSHSFIDTFASVKDLNTCFRTDLRTTLPLRRTARHRLCRQKHKVFTTTPEQTQSFMSGSLKRTETRSRGSGRDLYSALIRARTRCGIILMNLCNVTTFISVQSWIHFSPTSWWRESRAAASSLSNTPRDSQRGSGLDSVAADPYVNMMSHALSHSLSPMNRGVVILEYARVIGGEKPAHSVHSGPQLTSFLGHFSWLTSLISVLSLGYTAVQSWTLQFSSRCVWKYSYSTV